MKRKKTGLRKIVIMNILLCCSLTAIMLMAYNRGSEINKIIITGTNIIDCIKEFKSTNGDYPRELTSINSFCKTIADAENINQNYQYSFIEANIINEKNKNDKGFKKLRENSFRFYIISDVLKPDKMFYNERLNKFVITD